MTKAEYAAYLLTPHWARLRDKRLVAAGGRCEACGVRRRLHVHHLQYRNVVDCTAADLRVMCKGCHLTAHRLMQKGVIVLADHPTNAGKWRATKAAVLAVRKLPPLTGRKPSRK